MSVQFQCLSLPLHFSDSSNCPFMSTAPLQKTSIWVTSIKGSYLTASPSIQLAVNFISDREEAFDQLVSFSRWVTSNSFATPWTVVRQASLSKGFPRQEYWSGLPFPSPGDLLDSRTEPASPALQANSLPLSHQGSSWSV